MQNVKLGDRVRVQCSRVRTHSKGDAKPPQPKVLEFTAGSGGVMPGLSAGVLGMVPGEHKRLTLQPAEAYGQVQPELVKEIPRAQFPKRITLRVGKRLKALSTASGRQRRVRVVEISPKSVKVDGNHVLAGQVVELDVLLISVDASSEANRCSPQVDVER
ncbi:MAG: FKBP-type peptidyl-prolyl cis-trans isomerase [Planctomycetaceae bacterium]|nr:FKBP-type peptidyl-prolyl cis-trans isomerase [Planctomycetaceae bacterium]